MNALGPRPPPRAAAGVAPLLLALDRGRSEAQALWQVRRLVAGLGRDVVARPLEGLVAEARALRPHLAVVPLDAPPGPLGRWVRRRGAVARALVREAGCAVLSVRPGAEPIRRLLVPLDRTEAAARILPLVEEVALAYGARVLLLRVARRRDHLLDAAPATPVGLARSLEPARARLAAAGLEVEALGRLGDPRVEIVTCAEERAVDLVALTDRARWGLGAWLGGSCVDYVQREHRGALLVAP